MSDMQQEDNKTIADKVLHVLGLTGWVQESKVMQIVLYAVFLLGIGIVHVYNSHHAEGLIRDINKKEKEIKELRWEYTSVKSDLMLKSKQSALEEKLVDIGISTLKEPSKKIVVKKDEYKN